MISKQHKQKPNTHIRNKKHGNHIEFNLRFKISHLKSTLQPAPWTFPVTSAESEEKAIAYVVHNSIHAVTLMVLMAFKSCVASPASILAFLLGRKQEVHAMIYKR